MHLGVGGEWSLYTEGEQGGVAGGGGRAGVGSWQYLSATFRYDEFHLASA